jgi:hypothetical protein
MTAAHPIADDAAIVDNRGATCKSLWHEGVLVGEVLTVWTVRLAVGCYFVRLALDVTRAGDRYARQAWTAGCLLLWLHVAAAFEFHHAWSHAAAYAQTARETAAVTGIDWGGGLYVNYAFLVLWLADTTGWWLRPGWQQNRRYYWTVQGLFAFIVFNATAVFGPAFWNGIVLLAIVWLAWLRFRHRP